MDTAYHPAPSASFSMMGIAVAPLVTAADTAGTWEAILQTVQPGGGSPLHTLGCEKLFVVVSGRLVLTIDGAEHEAGAGSTATVAPGVPHCFLNRSDEPAQLLVVTGGAGHVDFLSGLARLTAAGPTDRASVEAHAAAHHVRLLQ